MSQEHVEIVRGIYAEWGRGNFRAGTDLYDPHVILAFRGDFPDGGVYVGHNGVGAYMREFLSDWTDAIIEAEDIVSAGDTVVAAVHQQATGSGSGIPTEMRYWQLWTFRGGAVIRIENIMSRSEALQAAGLPE